VLLLFQVAGLGFNALNAHAALQHFNGSVQRAIEHLLQSAGDVPADWLLAVRPSASSSASQSPTASASGMRDREAFDEISDISRDEDDYLDLMLSEEAEFLKEYKALINSA
jgi:hypothetical protein